MKDYKNLNLQAYHIICDLLTSKINSSHIIFSYCKDYSVVSIKENIYWICRIHFSDNKGIIVFPLSNYIGEKQIQIDSIQDIKSQSEHLIESYQNALRYIN